MEKSPHSTVFPRAKPWCVTRRWTDLPSISTNLLCTTFCAQDLPQHHLQQVRDSTVYHPQSRSCEGKNLQGLRTHTPAQAPHAGQEGCTFEVWTYRTYYFRRIRKEDASQKGSNILHTITIHPIYFHQGPMKLGNTPPGTLSNSKFTEA